MSRCLLITVRFNDGRFHGLPEWPPAPARLFQALLAGAARGRTISREAREALLWLERLPTPPLIAAPSARPGQALANFVPNNSLDAVGADPRRVSKIRTNKKIHPKLFDASAPLLYCWELGNGEDAVSNATAACALANGLFQLGRGVDMAWASGEVLDEPTAAARLQSHGGALYMPSAPRTGALPLANPEPGSLRSLETRWLEFTRRLVPDGHGRLIFAQPSKARFGVAYYGVPARRLLFDVRAANAAGHARWPAAWTAWAAERIRNAATSRLSQALPQKGTVVERALVGRGAGEAAKRGRVRIIPLPSIGHEHADHQIRRVVVEVPPDCPIPVGDLRWAFTGLEIPGESAHMRAALLVPADDEKFLRHFGVGDEGAPARLWRTVTPAALPWPHGRARSGPARLARDRRLEQGVRQALRHAGIEAPVARIRVQREPYDRSGDRAESFAAPPRFPAGRLWHVEIAFATPLTGPLVIGDGRYLGLGVMAPCREARRAVIEFGIEAPAGLSPDDAPAVTTAVRRAIMARARDELGNGSREIPRLFSGHERDGGAARSGRQEHIFIAVYATAAAGGLDRLLVAAPWACDKFMSPEHRDDDAFDRVVSGLRTVSMGPTGVLRLALPGEPQDGSRALGPATVWASATRYRATRHAGRGKDPVTAIVADVAAECRRRGLPEPRVELGAVRAGPNGGGPQADVRLTFSVAVRGPVLLGRDSHLGGGLFLAGADR